MFNRKKIKLYVYHGRYFSIKAGSKNRMLIFAAKLLNWVFEFLFFVGSAVIKLFLTLKKYFILACFGLARVASDVWEKAYATAKNEITNTNASLNKRFKLALRPQYLKTLSFFFVIAFLAWAALGGMRLVASALDLKNKIMRIAFVGNGLLDQAKGALSQQDFSQAQNKFALAYQTFSRAQDQLNQSNQTLNQLLSLTPQKQDADRLLAAAALVSKAGQDSLNLSQNFKNLKLSVSGISGGGAKIPDLLNGLQSGLGQTVSEISQANNLVSQVNPDNLPQANRETFANLKQQLFLAQFTLTNFQQIFALGKNLLLGQKNVLILFENNNELRAGGGFIGTYGDLKINDGRLSQIHVSSIYDLDGQLTDVIQPPQPLLNVGPRWYLRDANWFASWPLSAQKISGFYEAEGGETPDLVIAMTPNLIVDWLKITGPITLPNYGVTLTSDNFVEQTQAITTLSDNLPTNQPKQLLADLVPLLLQKISTAPAKDWPQIFQSLQDNLNGKQIVIYSKDQNLQNQLGAFHWTGDLENSDRDFLSVVSSNLGGTKTDLAVDQKIYLTTNISDDGTVTDEADIVRTDKMPDLPQTGNTSFVRVYAPLGSELLTNIGFDYKKLDYPAQNYKFDDDVYAWEKNSVTDNLTGTIIGQESGKTFFGNWVDLKGGESKTVKLVYKLPFKINDIDRLSLLLQKQIGSQNSDFSWTVNFAGRQIAWKNFDANLQTDSLNSGIILDKDYFLGLVLQK